MKASADNADVQALLDEQAALRRVATFVATAGEPARVFPIVTEEVGRLLAAQTANMVRYRHDGTADVIGRWNEPGVPSMPLGAGIELDGERLTPRICRSGQPERVDDSTPLTGRLAERLQQLGIASGVGAPIIFDGELWGSVVVSSVRTHAFAPRHEHRIAAFTELVAQALANARLTRQSVAAIATPQSAAAWKTVPSTYVVCDRDRAVPPPAREAMAARTGTVHRLPSSHSPFLSRPDEVAEIVLAAL